MEEIWKDIKDYAGLYQVSNFGRVKALEKKRLCNQFGGFCISKEKIMKFGIDKNGYYLINLSKNNKTSTKRVSRIVAETFISNPDNFPQVNHINGIKTDNNASNLEWCTDNENKKHAFRTGLKSHIGIKNPATNLTEDNVREIRKLKGVMSYPKIAKQFNTTEDAVYYIINNLTWKHVI